MAWGEGRVNPSPFSAPFLSALAPGASLAGWGGDWRSGELHLHLSQVRVWSQDSSVMVLCSSQMCVISVSASVCLNVSLSLLHTQSQVLSTLWE